MLNKSTIINGQEVKMSEEERIRVTKFHESRIAFAVIFKDDNKYELAINRRDAREHRIYLKEDFNIIDDIYETLIRGYIIPGKIDFYVSSYYKKADKNMLTEELLNELLNIAKNEFGEGEYRIGNGLVVGFPGREAWPPIEIICTYSIDSNGTIKRLDR